MDVAAIRRNLQPFQVDVLSGIYRYIVELCNKRQVTAVWVYLPRPEAFDHGPADFELQLAREAGFQVLVLEDVYPANQA